MTFEHELRTVLKDRAELIPELPAPYADLRRRVRRGNRIRAGGAVVVTIALAAAGFGAYHVTRHTVGAAATRHWPVRGDQAGDPTAVKQAETAAEQAVHEAPGSMMPVFVGTMETYHVVVAVAANRGPEQKWREVVLVDGVRQSAMGVVPSSGASAWATAAILLPDHDIVELILAESPDVTLKWSDTVTWDAAGTPQRTWSAVSMPEGFIGFPVAADHKALMRFRVYASGTLVDDEVVDDGKQPSQVPPSSSLLDSMQAAYGHPVNKAAVAQALTQAAPVAGDSDYASWQPKIIWSGTSVAYGPGSVLVQVRIRGSLLQGMAGSEANLQPGCFEPVPAGWQDKPYHFLAAPLGFPKAEVWAAGGVTAQTVEQGKVVGNAMLDAIGYAQIGPGDQQVPHPLDLTVRDAHGTVILHKTDINVQSGEWDLPYWNLD